MPFLGEDGYSTRKSSAILSKNQKNKCSEQVGGLPWKCSRIFMEARCEPQANAKSFQSWCWGSCCALTANLLFIGDWIWIFRLVGYKSLHSKDWQSQPSAFFGRAAITLQAPSRWKEAGWWQAADEAGVMRKNHYLKRLPSFVFTIKKRLSR